MRLLITDGMSGLVGMSIVRNARIRNAFCVAVQGRIVLGWSEQ